MNNEPSQEKVLEDFKKILDITYEYCKHVYDDDNIALSAQQINAKAYQVVKLLERNQWDRKS
jgi:hypothetical protein